MIHDYISSGRGKGEGRSRLLFAHHHNNEDAINDANQDAEDAERNQGATHAQDGDGARIGGGRCVPALNLRGRYKYIWGHPKKVVQRAF